MKNKLLGIHHVSAIGSDVNRTIKYYTELLGLKLVKKTVNYDNKYMYHLYFGDKDASIGTLLTIFIYNDNFMGRIGAGQVGTIAFEIPKGRIVSWEHHLRKNKVLTTKSNLFNKATIEFNDPDGLRIALVEGNEERETKDIIRIYGTVLLSKEPEKTYVDMLEKYNFEGIESNTHYTATLNNQVFIIPKEVLYQGIFGIGTVHHIAWAVETEEILLNIRDILYNGEYDVTDAVPRNYFTSIYSKDLGKIVYEFATINPGLGVDEEELGSGFMLPPWFEEYRQEILEKLPAIED